MSHEAAVVVLAVPMLVAILAGYGFQRSRWMARNRQQGER